MSEEVKEIQKEEKTSKGKALFSLIAGFCCMYVPFGNMILAVLAIVFGALSRKSKHSDLATIGLVLGIMFFIRQLLSSIIAMFMYGLYFLYYIFYAFVMIGSYH